MIVGARIEERMLLLGISQAELARRVGLKQPSIFQLIKRGKRGSSKLHLIARELQTTPAYLTGETDDPESDGSDLAPVSADAREMLDRFERLDAGNRRAVLQIVRSLTSDRSRPTPHEPR